MFSAVTQPQAAKVWRWLEAGETWLNVGYMLKKLLTRAADGLPVRFRKTSVYSLISFIYECVIPSKDSKLHEDKAKVYFTFCYIPIT